MDSNDAREPSTRPEGVNDTKGHPATSRLEGVTNLDFNKQDSADEIPTDCNKQDSADEIPTTSLRVRGGSPKSKGPGTRASRLGLFLSPGPPEVTMDPDVSDEPLTSGPAHEDIFDPARADPTDTLDPAREALTELSSLFALGASSSSAAPHAHDTPFGAPPSSLAPSAIAPDLPMPTLVATIASLSSPPEPTLLDALRDSTEAHHSTLSTLTFDINQLINNSRADNLAQREVTDRIALDLKTSITTQSTKDDAFRDEISATMRLLAETQHLKHEELKLLITNALLKAPSASLPDETEPPPTGRGTSRFTPPPWSRGRSLRDTTRQPTRLANP